MKTPTTPSHTFDQQQLLVINSRSKKILDELVKPDGIFASNDSLWNGQYHHYFGRDSAITAMLINEAEKISKNYALSPIALKALIAISRFQGQKNDITTGEVSGKIPHEINTSLPGVAQMKERMHKNGNKAWFIDETDGYLKNWDSVDSTPLWIIAIVQYIQDGWDVPPEIYDVIAKAASWCIDNIKEFGGYTG